MLHQNQLAIVFATYDYKAQQAGDLDLSKGDKLAVVEHLSEDWWKGYKSDSSPEKLGYSHPIMLR